MPVVTNTIVAPGGTLLTGRVSITLVGSNANPIPGYVTAQDRTIESFTQTAIVAGVWSLTLTANSLINPSGTRYKVQENVNDTTTTYYITVPNGAGPYFVEDILSEAPAAIASPALQTHIDKATAAHAASAVSFTPTGDLVATTVQAALAELDTEKARLVNGKLDPAQSATNTVTTDTAQTITGAKTFSAALATAQQVITGATGNPSLLTIRKNDLSKQATFDYQAWLNLGGQIGSFAPLTVAADAASTVPAIVRGAASQTADLLQLQNSAGTVLAKVNSMGNLSIAETLNINTAGAIINSNSDGSVILRAASYNFQTLDGTLAPMTLRGNTADATETLNVTAQRAGNPAIVARGAASQTADLQHWQNSAGTVLASVSSAGVVRGAALNVAGLFDISRHVNGNLQFLGGSVYGYSFDGGLIASGNVETSPFGAGFILKSPSGARYRIAVSDAGALSAVAA